LIRDEKLVLLLKFFQKKDGKFEMRKIHVPPNRFNPLKDNWMKIYTPVVDYLKLQIRFNLKSRNIELKVV
jgi:RNA-binding protein PNO1